MQCSLFGAIAVMGHKVIAAVTHRVMWLLLHKKNQELLFPFISVLIPCFKYFFKI